MKRFISIITSIIILFGTIPCIAEEYDIPPAEVDEVLTPSDSTKQDEKGDVSKDDKKTDTEEKDAVSKTDEKDNKSNSDTDNKDTKTDSSKNKDNFDKGADELLKKILTEDFKIEIYSKYPNHIFEEILKNSDIKSKRSKQKDDLKDFIDVIQYTMDTEGKKISDNIKENLKIEYENSNDGIYVCMYSTSSKKYELYISNNQAVTWFGSFKLDSLSAMSFASFLEKGISGNPKGIFYNFNFDNEDDEKYGIFDFKNKTFQYDGGSKINFTDAEKIEFDITVNEDFELSIFEDLGNIGGTVHCTLENLLSISNYNYFILTLNGKNGKRQYAVCNTDYGWQGGYRLYFLTNEYIEENGKYISDSGMDADYIYIIGRIDKQSELEIAVQYNPMNNNGKPRKKVSFDNATMASNVKYEYFLSGSDVERCRLTLYNLYGLPFTKEEYIKQTKEKDDEEENQKTDEKDKSPKDEKETNDINKEEEKETNKIIFEDVTPDHWAYDDISSLAEKKIILGYGDGRFGTNDSVTSEQVSLLLDRLFEYKSENNSTLPEKRETIIVLIVKALKANVADTDTSIVNEKFNDCDSVTEDDKKYIAYAIDMGLVKGYNGKLNPEDNVTRAETAALLCRALNEEK